MNDTFHKRLLPKSQPRPFVGLALADLPSGSASLYTVHHRGGCLGIGTPDELAELVDDFILPPASELSFVLEMEL